MKTLIALILFASFSHAAEVAWRHGEVEKALADAAKDKKPLLVYWGAIWCPPCNALKAKAFKDPAFVEATKAFIPVYLDGDSKDAQIWGEKLQATGYPTLLVLDSGGKEVQRLVTSDSLENLIAEMKAAATATSDLDELLRKSAVDIAGISKDDWLRLGHHDWFGDDRFKEKDQELAKNLARLADAAPAEVKMRLELAALSAACLAKKPLTDGDRVKWRAFLNEVLDNPAEVKANGETLSFYADDYAHALYPDNAAERDKFIAKYLAAFRRYREDKTLTLEARVYSAYAFTGLSNGKDAKFPPVAKADADLLVKELREELRAADTDEKRVLVLNTLGYVYGDLGRAAEAEKILVGALPKLRAKNEVMSSIADLEEKQGHKDKALRWNERAYREALGGPTRLQWGQVYVKDLIAQAPKRRKDIEKDARTIIAEALTRSDSFYGRNWRSLNRLAQNLEAWAKQEKVKDLREQVLAKDVNCEDLKVNAAAMDRCKSFVKQLAQN